MKKILLVSLIGLFFISTVAVAKNPDKGGSKKSEMKTMEQKHEMKQMREKEECQDQEMMKEKKQKKEKKMKKEKETSKGIEKAAEKNKGKKKGFWSKWFDKDKETGKTNDNKDNEEVEFEDE